MVYICITLHCLTHFGPTFPALARSADGWLLRENTTAYLDKPFVHLGSFSSMILSFSSVVLCSVAQSCDCAILTQPAVDRPQCGHSIIYSGVPVALP